MSNPFEAPRTFASAVAPRVQRLQRIGVLSSGLFGGAIFAALGLIGGGFFTFFTLITLALGGDVEGGTAVAIGMAFAMLIFVPLFYGIIGFLMGIVSAFVYNLIAGMTGGLELELS